MKLSRALLVVALVLVFVAPAFAETQNVKVSGSIDAYWFYRNNYDLLDNNDAGVLSAGTAVPGQAHAGSLTQRSEADDYFMSTTQVEISADLTDNVSTVINLLNERDWNDSSTAAGSTTAAAQFDIDLDLAYVQMKEIFYSPLTLTIGRQDLWFGRGFIVGNNNHAWDRNGNIAAKEYSASTAFDAMRATLDFSPWTLDFVYSKIAEGSNNPENDIDLYVANVNYKFAEYNAVAEGYYVGEVDRATLATTAGMFNNDTETLGARVQFDPISQITLGGELAYQFGDYRASLTVPTRDRAAWAADIFGTYRWDYTWKPSVTLEYVSFSGEEDLGAGATNEYGAWNGLYRGHFWTAYADFREFVYATAQADDQPATTNQEFIQVKGAIKPLEDLLVEAAYTYLWTPERVHKTPGVLSSATENDNIGSEFDLQVTYDYTEDVSFGILAGWFIPGNFYISPNDATAADVVSSVKVTF